MAGGIFIPTKMETVPPAVALWSLNHWTSREVQWSLI